MIIVHHVQLDRLPEEDRRSIIFGDEGLPERLWREGYYRGVAAVDTDDMNVAWRSTNHVNESWTDFLNVWDPYNGGRVTDPQRSSMVGDIFEVMVDGKATFHMVDRFGFRALDIKPAIVMDISTKIDGPVIVSHRGKRKSFPDIDTMMRKLEFNSISDDARAALVKAGKKGDMMFVDFNPYQSEMSGGKVMELLYDTDEDRLKETTAALQWDI